MANLNRRAALIGAAVSSLSILPAISSVRAKEPHGEVRRLQSELSAALARLAAQDSASDFVSVVYPAGTVPYARTLMDRDIWEDTREREARQGAAIGQWQFAEQQVEKYLEAWSADDGFIGSPLEWEALDGWRRDCMDLMHKILRT